MHHVSDDKRTYRYGSAEILFFKKFENECNPLPFFPVNNTDIPLSSFDKFLFLIYNKNTYYNNNYYMRRAKALQCSFHHKLMKTYFAMHRCVMAGAKKLGLTSGQPKILEYLSEQEGIEQKMIAKNCEIESATVGSILDRMEKNGLIERRRRDGNRRSLYVYLSPAGKAAAAEMEKIFAAAEEAAFCGMSREEISLLRENIEKVYENLTKQGGSL